MIQDVDDLVKNQTQLMDAIEGLKANASDLLVDGHRQSDALQLLLSDAEAARKIAADAVKSADFILSEAQNTLTTLQGHGMHMSRSLLLNLMHLRVPPPCLINRFYACVVFNIC